MIVYIVVKNGKVDEVFDSKIQATNHLKNLLKKWSLAYILEKNVNIL